MRTKKQIRQIDKRKVRRVLNLVPDFFKAVSGRRLNRNGWDRGVSRSEVRSCRDAPEFRE